MPAPATTAVPPAPPTPLATDHQTLRYLVTGNAALLPLASSSFRSRSTLRSVRYVGTFIFWRLIRYFKYAAIAGATAAVAGSVIGPLLPVVMAIAVPSIPMAAALGLGTAVVKFGWKHRGNHFREPLGVNWRQKWGGQGGDARKDEARDAE